MAAAKGYAAARFREEQPSTAPILPLRRRRIAGAAGATGIANLSTNLAATLHSLAPLHDPNSTFKSLLPWRRLKLKRRGNHSVNRLGTRWRMRKLQADEFPALFRDSRDLILKYLGAAERIFLGQTAASPEYQTCVCKEKGS